MTKEGAVAKLFKRLQPWRVTGVASTPEFQTYLPQTGEWRKHAPSNPPVQPAIPHAKPDRVYDIKYWVRDARRGGMVVGGTNTRFIDVASVDVGPAAVAAEAAPAEAPPAVGAPYRWKKRVPLLDNPNNGYT